MSTENKKGALSPSTFLVIGDITKNFAMYSEGEWAASGRNLQPGDTARYLGGAKEIRDFIVDCFHCNLEPRHVENNPCALGEYGIHITSPFPPPRGLEATPIPAVEFSPGKLPYTYWQVRKTNFYGAKNQEAKNLRAFIKGNTNIDRREYVGQLGGITEPCLVAGLDCLIVSEAGFGFEDIRFSREKAGVLRDTFKIFLPNPENPLALEDKLRRAEAGPPCAEGENYLEILARPGTLIADTTKYSNILTIVSCDFLRDLQWSITRKLDWETTLSDVIREYGGKKSAPGFARFLSKQPVFIITFGVVGAMMIRNLPDGTFVCHVVVDPHAEGQILRDKDSHGDVKCKRRSFVYSLIRHFALWRRVATDQDAGHFLFPDFVRRLCVISGWSDLLHYDGHCVEKKDYELDAKAVLKRGVALAIQGFKHGYPDNRDNRYVGLREEEITFTPPGSVLLAHQYHGAFAAQYYSLRYLLKMCPEIAREDTADVKRWMVENYDALKLYRQFGDEAITFLDAASNLVLNAPTADAALQLRDITLGGDKLTALAEKLNQGVGHKYLAAYRPVLQNYEHLLRYYFSCASTYKDIATLRDRHADTTAFCPLIPKLGSSKDFVVAFLLELFPVKVDRLAKAEMVSTDGLRHLVFLGGDRPNFLRQELIPRWEPSWGENPDGLARALAPRLEHICMEIVRLGARKALGNRGRAPGDDPAANPDDRFIVPVRTYGMAPAVLHAATREQILAFNSLENFVISYLRHHAGERRPLNIGIFGAPGSGKSYGPKCIFRQIPELQGDKMALIECNLANMRKPDDLQHVFLEASAACGTGRVPVVLFDEFDSTFEGNEKGWVKHLISPMQDGYFSHQEVRHYFQKAIFLFAGGTSNNLKDFGEHPRDETARKALKIPDFVSRLTTSLSISGVNLHDADFTSARQEDRVDRFIGIFVQRSIILRSIMEKNRFIQAGQELSESSIHREVLRHLLFDFNYQYGSRSLETILTVVLTRASKLRMSDLAVLVDPANGPLAHHVSELSWEEGLRDVCRRPRPVQQAGARHGAFGGGSWAKPQLRPKGGPITTAGGVLYGNENPRYIVLSPVRVGAKECGYRHEPPCRCSCGSVHPIAGEEAMPTEGISFHTRTSKEELDAWIQSFDKIERTDAVVVAYRLNSSRDVAQQPVVAQPNAKKPRASATVVE